MILALVKYYARLIKKGTYTMEDVPEKAREEVQAQLDLMEEEEKAAEE